MSHETPVQVMVGDRARLALGFAPATNRLHIPGKAVGSYLLLDPGEPYLHRALRSLPAQAFGSPIHCWA